MDRFLSDLRIASRVLTRSPGFSLIAVLVLALGIGANTAIFSVIDGILLEPLAFPDPRRLVTLCETNPETEGYCIASPANVEDLVREARSLQAGGVARGEPMLLVDNDTPDWISAGVASPGFFEALRVRPQLGRLFLPEENGANGARVVLLTDGFWTNRFGADPDIVGRAIQLDDEAYTVVGVLPEGFQAPQAEWVTLWTPLPWDLASSELREWRGFAAIGRLAPEVSVSVAAEELSRVHAGLEELHPAENEGYSLVLRELHDYLVGSTRPTLLLFLGAVALVLLVACANLANLLLARGSRRLRELAVRSSLGARRLDLVLQLMVENMLLALAGGAVGVLLAVWSVDLFVSLAPSSIPRLETVDVDGLVLVFALAATIATTFAFGLLPTLRGTDLELAQTIREGGFSSSGRRTGRLRGLLVISEVALALMLLVGAGLLTRSFLSFLRWEPGFETENLLTFQVFAPVSRYPTGQDVALVFQQAREAVGALPGTVSVGMASAGPLFGGREPSRFVADHQELDAATAPVVRWFDLDPFYFSTLGLPILRGRDLLPSDELGGPPVAVINEAMARLAFPGEDPVGRVVNAVDRVGEVTVVGVVPDVPPFMPGQSAEPEIYWSNRQFPRWGTFFLIRTQSDPGALVEPIRDRLAQVDPTLQIANVADLEARASFRLVTPRFNMALVGIFALVALALASAGIYGVMTLTVAQRTREIGIRMALGAKRNQVLARVVRDGMLLVLGGLVLGCLGAMAASRLISGLVFGVSHTDPVAFGATALALALSGLAACALPALRASRVDTMDVLREE